MGSDSSPPLFFNSVLFSLQKFPFLHFVLFVTEEAHTFFERTYQENKNITFCLSHDYIRGDEDPLKAVREKKDSTLLKGISALKEKNIDALLSAGNTGALIAAASIFLSRYETIKRPPLIATFPTKSGPSILLDAGGNLVCKAKDLIQFAKLGIAYHRAVFSSKSPKIGLLNVGIESKKGTHELQEAYLHLKAHEKELNCHFIGNVEPYTAFEGTLDILVSDGLAGNILLKTFEGISSYILKEIDGPTLANHPIKTLLNRELYEGALIAGFEELLLKCHGNISEGGLLSAIEKTVYLLENSVTQKMKESLPSKKN